MGEPGAEGQSFQGALKLPWHLGKRRNQNWTPLEANDAMTLSLAKSKR